jgi:hypothetical protein
LSAGRATTPAAPRPRRHGRDGLIDFSHHSRAQLEELEFRINPHGWPRGHANSQANPSAASPAVEFGGLAAGDGATLPAYSARQPSRRMLTRLCCVASDGPGSPPQAELSLGVVLKRLGTRCLRRRRHIRSASCARGLSARAPATDWTWKATIASRAVRPPALNTMGARRGAAASTLLP